MPNMQQYASGGSAVGLALSVREEHLALGSNPERLLAKEVAYTNCELCPPVRHCVLLIYVLHYRHVCYNLLFTSV